MTQAELEKPSRKPRADAVRNRELVLAAATSVFNAGGPDASLEAVARAAGVGIGTLYRHFPTREALFEAVYRREVEQLVELAESLRIDATPVEALRHWVAANIEFIATKKGMSAALALAAHQSSSLSLSSLERLGDALSSILHRGVDAGQIRADIGAEDLIRTLFGLSYTHDKPGWKENVLRLMNVFIDGMRTG